MFVKQLLAIYGLQDNEYRLYHGIVQVETSAATGHNVERALVARVMTRAADATGGWMSRVPRISFFKS